eukprot:TRINITY_DN7138_c0_g1_i1.p1 TRINITY_DN7138_c0_g1~~TRINITY_DN7138_c0_g1_i1.p1  ORF type:complete len:283 (+),score=55.32 TRINITY_DN7138_c0_g1_i1:24-872(+)
MEVSVEVEKAAKYLKEADAILIGTGAGMGVDSGLGTFRGRNAGVWPPLVRLNMDFTEASNPKWFPTQPNFAWAFWVYRYNAYTSKEPHQGYHILKNLSTKKKFGAFSYTSNIDGHWLKCGFEENRVFECHGTVHYMQCQKPCQEFIYPTSPEEMSKMVFVKDDYVQNLPHCPKCGLVARPNVDMFDDVEIITIRQKQQTQDYQAWLSQVQASGGKLAVIEIGAGLALPVVREECERVAKAFSAPLIRLNLDDNSIPPEIPQGVSLPMGALQALSAIELAMNS